jgi:subfamily B ATP-binding cassette protein MsbA
VPVFRLSIDSVKDIFNYYFARIIVENGKADALLFICVVVVIIIFLKNIFRYLAMYFMANVRMGVVKDIRNNMQQKILHLPLSYYSGERKGDLISRMTTDVQEIEWSVMQSIEMLFRDPVQVIVLLGAMIYVSPHLSLWVFLLAPVPVLLIGQIARSLRKTSVKGKERLGTLFSFIEETLGGIRIIKAFNAEKFTLTKFIMENNFYTKIMIRMYRKADLASPLSEFLGTVVLMIIIYIGGTLVLETTFEESSFIFYIALFYQLIAPSKSFTTAYYNIQKGIASAQRIEKILHAEDTIKEVSHPKEIVSFNTAIEYKNVSFAYRKGDEGHVLKDISLKIEKGKTIALVGQSGSGKTTLVDMLPRFYDPDKGEILIDGIPVRELKITSLRNLMGIVSQESILFNDTVENNIAFGTVINGNAELSKRVEEAAKIANAHDFIMQLPQKYQTNIGDKGGLLSGGQRQRLAIARAVFKNPPILILDEATSALDSESERLVQDALKKLMKGRTSIVIAHRLSTIQHADEIIVLHKGYIVERGKHLDLLAKNGEYKKLYDMQTFV